MIHILKWAFLIVAVLVTLLTGMLLVLSIKDVRQVKREQLNGAIQFMTLDNLRHQGALFSLSLLMLWCAHLTFGLSQDVAPYFLKYSLPANLLIASGGLVDASFTFRRRRRMASLVGEYLGQRGGRRKTDPPIIIKP